MKLLTAIATTALVSYVASLSVFAANETVMYKKVDKDGNVVFTDKPIPGSKEVKVQTDTNVVDTPKATVFMDKPTKKKKSDNKDSQIYPTLAIDKPEANQAVQTVNGNITVIVGISPKLKSDHQLQMLLDGDPVGMPQSSAYFSLTGVNKGSHTLKVVVIDKTDPEGREIQSSDSVTFKAY